MGGSDTGHTGSLVQKMLPHLDITGPVAMQLQPLLALKAAADRVAEEVSGTGIKRVVSNTPLMLSNSARGMQELIVTHLSELRRKRFQNTLPVGTEC